MLASRELLFWCARASVVPAVSNPGTRSPAKASAGEAALAAGHKGGGRQGWGEASPGAQPTATQVEKRRRALGQEAAGSKEDATWKNPELGHSARRENASQILLLMIVPFPPSPQRGGY